MAARRGLDLPRLASLIGAALVASACAGEGSGAPPAGAPGTPGTSGLRAATTRQHTPTLADPRLKEIARRLISSAENSTLDWRSQYRYIEYNVEQNAAENRGYTGGIVGFTSRTHDMLALVRRYTAAVPHNPLARYLPALTAVDGTPSTRGLGRGFVAAWRAAATDPRFQSAQRDLADQLYFTPATNQGVADGLGALGQFVYVDAMVMHGPGSDPASFGGIREAALSAARPPARGGNETAYLHRFLDARVAAMRREEGHSDVSRVEGAQRRFLREGNLALRLPLRWRVYGDQYTLSADAILGE